MQKLHKQKTGAIIIDKRERAIQALELRKAGVGYELIAQRLNYSNRSAAYRAVSRLLGSMEKEATQDMREVELRRLDDLFLSIYKKARDGDLAAVDRCLRIMERRAKIAGIDAPEKTQTDVRQVIKVVYEDVQYAEDFDDEENVRQNAGLISTGVSGLSDDDSEEYEGDDDGEEYGEYDEESDDDELLSPDNTNASIATGIRTKQS
jgi:hypothetical protein